MGTRAAPAANATTTNQNTHRQRLSTPTVISARKHPSPTRNPITMGAPEPGIRPTTTSRTPGETVTLDDVGVGVDGEHVVPALPQPPVDEVGTVAGSLS